jgi:DNA-binding winged helix-turn-helix (wHTH) protein
MVVLQNSQKDKGMAAGVEQGAARRLVVWGGAFVLVALVAAAVVLFLTLPDANTFNDRVAQIFEDNDALVNPSEINLLMVLGQSGTTFAEVLSSYRLIILVLLVLAFCLLLSSLYFLYTNAALNQRLLEIERSGLHITSLVLNREQKLVAINNMEFGLTDNALETLSVLCEARLDDEIISGVELEAAISGKNATDCEEAAGATRIKRLRDHLGNQLLSQLLIRHVAREGYMLTISPDVIRLR